MNQTLKQILSVALFGVIAYLTIIFIISTGTILIVLAVIGLGIYGAYELWEKYAKKELLKHEENFDTLKEGEK
ncbi:MAG TPA: hypothetical protein PLL26_02690 [Candidatus Dojkabacteria bacterium]|nr:hypothetical protein [Candidatus Dojkabacteria bacterium]